MANSYGKIDYEGATAGEIISSKEDYSSKYDEFCEMCDRSISFGHSVFLENAEKCLSFYRGDQWTDGEVESFKKAERTPYIYNKIATSVDLLDGRIRDSHFRASIESRSSNGKEDAYDNTKILDFIQEKTEFRSCLIDATCSAIRTGLSLIEIFWDYSNDPYGELSFRNVDFREFMIDPTFSSLDLSDCQYLVRRNFWTVEEILCEYPNLKERDLRKAYVRKNFVRDAVKKKYFNWVYNIVAEIQRNKIVVDTAWIREGVTQKFVVHDKSGTFSEWTEDRGDIDEYLLENEGSRKLERRVPGVVKYVFVNGVMVHKENASPNLLSMPFVAIPGIFTRSEDLMCNRFQPVMLKTISPQRAMNQLITNVMSIASMQTNSGYFYADGMVSDANSLLSGGPGRLIKVNTAGGGIQDSVMPIVAPPLDPSLVQFFQTLEALISTALSSDALGGEPSSGNESALMLGMRRESAASSFNFLMDNYRSAQIYLAWKSLDFMKTISLHRIRGIIGKDPSSSLLSPVSRRDITISDIAISDTQRQLHFKQILEFSEILATQSISDITLKLLLDNAPLKISEELKDSIIQYENAKKEADSELAEIDKKLKLAQIDVQTSIAAANFSMASERNSRAQLNLADTVVKSITIPQEALKGSIEVVKLIMETALLGQSHSKATLENISQVFSIAKQVELGGSSEEKTGNKKKVVNKIVDFQP